MALDTAAANPGVLHLLSPGDGGESALVSARGVIDALQAEGVSSRAVVIGGSEEARRAVRVVGRCANVCNVPRRRWPTHLIGSGMVARACQPRARVTIAYGLDALLCYAAPARDERADFFVTDRTPPGLRGMQKWLVRYALTSTPVVTPCESIAERWRELAPAVEVVDAGVARGARPLERREASRAVLGIAPGAVVVMMLADPPESGDARRFLHECGTVVESGSPVVGLISRSADGLARAARYQEAFGRAWPLIAAEGPMSALMEAADVMVFHAAMPGEGGLQLARLAVDLGIPIVAPLSQMLVQVVGDQPTLAAGADYLSLARALLKVVRQCASGKRPVALTARPEVGGRPTLADRVVAHLRALRGDAPSRSGQVEVAGHA
ncbi:MAG: hypothetical protein ACT4PL_09000 [Phycisphaerales bacterium]